MGLSNFIKNLVQATKTTAFDPGVFNDELASKVSWSPKAGGGANFKTKKLVQISDTELQYKASSFGKIFGALFIIFPLVFTVLGITAISKFGFKSEGVLFALVPLIFIGVGIFIIKKFNSTITFNKSSGYFHRSKKKEITSLTVQEDAHNFKLDTIKALQILPERVRGDKSSYTSYEINLVFEDGSRYNIVDHGHRKSIETDAVTLSDFLGVPAWNKMTGTTYLSSSSTTNYSYNSLEPHDLRSNKNNTSYDSSSTTYASDSTYETDDLDSDYDSTKPRKM
ncbi:hypothetical protein [Dokdonia donghaensis]|uniref:Uncharacterized protein n=1 Tax=Dokdonia donghaensis DSW-1 TaxID=1300343 RepID=A0A0A2GTH2_9FLAO|nr:hypothetical protein [Dokdonia donghaensis]ANH60963.1 hypothetical protein I597_2065 [Dokdonia donghaensis DSW-1]KGO05793.1 hypothetical protein NV36_02330 [Dokdonia donghaensis DSW-1]